MFGKDISPGPIYYINPLQSRYGRDGAPAYSLLGRQNEPSIINSPLLFIIHYKLYLIPHLLVVTALKKFIHKEKGMPQLSQWALEQLIEKVSFDPQLLLCSSILQKMVCLLLMHTLSRS